MSQTREQMILTMVAVAETKRKREGKRRWRRKRRIQMKESWNGRMTEERNFAAAVAVGVVVVVTAARGRVVMAVCDEEDK
jgi:hypothetical protein